MSRVPIYRVDPLRDARWAALVEHHPVASVFHSPGWIEALRRTYAYEPVVLTTSPPGEEELANGIVFCRVNSWLTGCRLVSLPFSDHCEPLVGSHRELEHLMAAAVHEVQDAGLSYVEIRPIATEGDAPRQLERTQTFCLHRLSLRPSLDELFRGFHKSCVQRKIRRAEREALSYEHGRSEALLQKFYYLIRLTRQRQSLPPQPLAWFRNLLVCMGDQVQLRVASRNGYPVAGILTLAHNKTLVYKYGCSDKRFSNLGGMQLLFWRAIQEAKRDGLAEMDMGRSDRENEGLVAFKARWGAVPSELVYWRYSTGHSSTRVRSVGVRVCNRIFRMAPGHCINLGTKILYRHLG